MKKGAKNLLELHKYRGHSVGYSNQERARLRERDSIIVEYYEYPKGIVKHQDGKEHHLGAYSGYSTEKVILNGEEVWMTHPEMQRILNQYKIQ